MKKQCLFYLEIILLFSFIIILGFNYSSRAQFDGHIVDPFFSGAAFSGTSTLFSGIQDPKGSNLLPIANSLSNYLFEGVSESNLGDEGTSNSSTIDFQGLAEEYTSGLQNPFGSTTFMSPVYVPPYELPTLPLPIYLPKDPIVSIMEDFTPFDMNNDGVEEINYIEFLPFESPYIFTPDNKKLVLVLIEPRLLENIPGSQYSQDDFISTLKRYKEDLGAEGYATRFIEMQVYDGANHQDGRTVLAIREFFKEVKQQYPHLYGAVIIGSFPEAMIVRRLMWKVDWEVTINGTDYSGVDYLRIVPERVAGQADLVLADLDGKWHNLYVEGPRDLTSIEAIPANTMGDNWPINNQIFASSIYNDTVKTFEDFFWIQDDNFYRLSSINGNLRLRLFTTLRNPEMNASDLALPNPVARPDIFVSRINARHIAINPNPNFTDIFGEGFLADDGKPQAVESASPINLSIGNFWHRDPVLEMRILIDFFNRNHQFRVGGHSNIPFRTASIRSTDNGLHSPNWFNNYLMLASSDWESPVVTDNASLLDYINWIKTPAVLRGIAAHSSPWNSEFGSTYDYIKLEDAAGGRPWRWAQIENSLEYIPSFEKQAGTAGLYLHRTLWENKILTNSGANLFIHTGCNLNTPGNVDTQPYNYKYYGSFQASEGVLFYLNGIALMARSKVFNDAPGDFTAAIGKHERNHFGTGWKGYFDHDGQDAGLALFNKAAGNKKSYNWNIIGDWTVRVRYLNGLGILELEGSNLKDYDTHADKAWIDDWDYDANLNEIKGIGDFNGDGRDDFIVLSDWGIGISTNIDNAWKQIIMKPSNTWFGEWRFESNKNTIEGVGDFNGDGKKDILISSDWGVGILTLSGNTMTSIMAKPKDTWFGAWRYNASCNVGKDKIQGIGDFDGDGRDDILISSTWGIGILKLYGNTLTSIMAKPKDTWFGAWRYNASCNVGKDKIQGIGDFDGDGRDDILISSTWGIGILKLYGNTLTSIMAKPKDTWFGAWRYNASCNMGEDKIEGIGDFDGDSRDDILISSTWGIGILKLYGNTLTSIMSKPKDTWFGAWRYNASCNVGHDYIQGIGDFNGDGKDDIFITSSWGIGVLRLHGSTLTSIQAKPCSSMLGNWLLSQNDVFTGVGNFNGDGKEEMLVQKKSASSSSWAVKIAYSTSDVYNFLNKLGGYTTSIQDARISYTRIGSLKKFTVLYKEGPSSGSWNWKLATTPMDVVNFLNTVPPYSQSIKRAEIAGEWTGSYQEFYIFYQTGRTEGKQWKWMITSNLDYLVDSLNKESSNASIAAMNVEEKNSTLYYAFYRPNSSPASGYYWNIYSTTSPADAASLFNYADDGDIGSIYKSGNEIYTVLLRFDD